MDHLRPLPDDILAMNEDQTACQYCGISYLLLSKYEKMCLHVDSLETNLAQLQVYVQERASVMEQMQNMDSKLILQTKELNAANNLVSAQEQNITSLQQDNTRNAKKLLQLHKTFSHASKELIALLESLAMLRRDNTSLQHTLTNFKRHIIDWSAIKSSIRDYLHHQHSKSIENTLGITSQINTLATENKQLEKLYSELLNSFKQSQVQNGERITSLETINASLKKINEDHTDRLQDTNNKYEKCVEMNLQFKEQNEHLIVQVQDFQKEITQKRQECTDIRAELNAERSALERSSESSMQIMSSESNDTLKEKHDEILRLCTNLKRCNDQIRDMQSERKRTIEAHQNRIKELQEKFKNDLLELNKSKENEHRHQNIMLENEIKQLCTEIDGLKVRLENSEKKTSDEVKKNQKFEADVLYYKQILNDQEHKTRLEIEEMKKTKAQRETSAQNEASKSIIELQNKINSLIADNEALKVEFESKMGEKERAIEIQQSEIVFLKDTVHSECEERTELIKKIDALKSIIRESQNAKRQVETNKQIPSKNITQNIGVKS